MVRQMARLAIGLIAAMFSMTALAWDAAEVITSLRTDGPRAAAFTEIKYLQALEHPLRLEGEVRFTPPDGMEKHVTSPYDEQMSVKDGWLRLQRGKKSRELALEKHPVARSFVMAFTATLAGDHASLAQHYEIELAGEPRDWQLTLVPKDEVLRDKVSLIEVKGNTDILQSFETRQPGGDRSIMIFSFLPRPAAETGFDDQAE